MNVAPLTDPAFFNCHLMSTLAPLKHKPQELPLQNRRAQGDGKLQSLAPFSVPPRPQRPLLTPSGCASIFFPSPSHQTLRVRIPENKFDFN